MTPEENKQLLRTFSDEMHKGNLGAVRKLLSEDFVSHDLSRPEFAGDREAFLKEAERYVDAIRNAKGTVEDIFAVGDKVVLRWTCAGTQVKDLPNIPSRGKNYRIAGITIARVVQGKITELWESCDVYGLMTQLGALPELAHAAR